MLATASHLKQQQHATLSEPTLQARCGLQTPNFQTRVEAKPRKDVRLPGERAQNEEERSRTTLWGADWEGTVREAVVTGTKKGSRSKWEGGSRGQVQKKGEP